MGRLCLVIFSLLLSSVSQAMLLATLEGSEGDLSADGRRLHVVVAGYGGGMGNLPYEMAVSRAKQIKRNFPNERVLILGSTDFKEGEVLGANSPQNLERLYDISLSADSRGRASTWPLTSSQFSANVLRQIADPTSLRRHLNENGNISASQLQRALLDGRIRQSGEIASIDFITHSTPTSGILLHNDTSYYRKTTNPESGAGSYGIDQIDTAERSLSAQSANIQALNGFFTEDAYVNMAGCSGGYGVARDLSRDLGVPVHATANGSEVYVMDKDGEFYYDYAQSNPHESKELTQSAYGFRGHELSASLETVPSALRPALRLYRGYWGNMRSGTNFTVTACPVRGGNSDDIKRCQMGMARRIEDSVIETSAAYKLGPNGDLNRQERLRAYVDAIKENMCPNGHGLDSDYVEVTENCERAIDVLASLSTACNLNVEKLNPATSLSEVKRYIDEKNRNNEDIVPDSRKQVCESLAQEYIEKHKDFVPLLDEDGQTLYCDFNGCQVKLKNCEVTRQEAGECLGEQLQVRDQSEFLQCLRSDEAATQCLLNAYCPTCSASQISNFKKNNSHYTSYKNCLKSKRCEIDESRTRASNDNNFTFMNHIQNYIEGYFVLRKYREHEGPAPFFKSERPGPMDAVTYPSSNHSSQGIQ